MTDKVAKTPFEAIAVNCPAERASHSKSDLSLKHIRARVRVPKQIEEGHIGGKVSATNLIYVLKGGMFQQARGLRESIQGGRIRCAGVSHRACRWTRVRLVVSGHNDGPREFPPYEVRDFSTSGL